MAYLSYRHSPFFSDFWFLISGNVTIPIPQYTTPSLTTTSFFLPINENRDARFHPFHVPSPWVCPPCPTRKVIVSLDTIVQYGVRPDHNPTGRSHLLRHQPSYLVIDSYFTVPCSLFVLCFLLTPSPILTSHSFTFRLVTTPTSDQPPCSNPHRRFPATSPP